VSGLISESDRFAAVGIAIEIAATTAPATPNTGAATPVMSSIVIPSAMTYRERRTSSRISSSACASSNNGQACINAKHFIVHADIYDEFAQKFSERMAALVIGDPAASETEIGPLATESGRNDIEELVEDARVQGAAILTGGKRPHLDGGWYYEPTVIADLTTHMRLFAEEAFGPVASLYRVNSLEEAFAVANNSDFGLGSAFWSNDPDEIEPPSVASRPVRYS